MNANRPLFRKLDNLLLRVADLDAAISFYRDRLGHELAWRSGEAVGFALPDTDAELVCHLRVGPETDVLVENVDEAFAVFLAAGGEAIEPPFGIASAGARAFGTRSATNSLSLTSPRGRWRPTTRGG